MEALTRSRHSTFILVVTSALIVNVGCSGPPHELRSVKSPANAKNQIFDEQLIGTWAAFTADDDEPYMLISVTRQTGVPKSYIFKMNDPEDREGDADLSGRLRLLRIGGHEFVELESTIPEDAPADEKLPVDGRPFQTAYNLWRITRTKDALQVWGFKDRHILRSLPESEIIPAVPRGKNMTIANCSADQLQDFLLKNGDQMSKKAEDFKRYE